MSDVFYRMHWRDCPEFCAENAWSALWGSVRSADGAQTRCGCDGVDQGELRECRPCAGTGYRDTGDGAMRCRSCDGDGCLRVGCTLCCGTGWLDCVRGYSCWSTPDQLIDYFEESGRDHPGDNDGRVLVFTGVIVDCGFDGEPTVLPDGAPIESMTWTEFLTYTDRP
jgi:hypothetical protein